MSNLQIIGTCPGCGSRGELYTSALNPGKFKVSCAAQDANFHGQEDVADDWCPLESDQAETRFCDSAEEAALEWERITEAAHTLAAVTAERDEIQENLSALLSVLSAHDVSEGVQTIKAMKHAIHQTEPALRELRDWYRDVTGLPACKANAALPLFEPLLKIFPPPPLATEN